MGLSKNIIKTKLKFWISNKEVNEWFSSREVFFILGMGRSGTKFLSELLGTDKTALVFHEPITEDFESTVAAHKSNSNAEEYIKSYRKKRMYLLAIDHLRSSPYKIIRIYGEINSALRFHAGALQKFFPNAKILHLVRDGREVVRSIMARKHYTKTGVGHHSLAPREDDFFFCEWDRLTRFEKVCWLWADANKRLRENVRRYVQFEKLISDYSYFHENIESYIEIDIGEEQWSKAVKKPENVTKAHVFPHWTEWDTSLMKSFNNICGGQMVELGYF